MEKVLTFRVEIEGLEDKIWRKIEIPDKRTVADLAYTILASFDSLAYHLYNILDECYSNGIFNKEIRDEVFPLDEFNYYYFKSINYYEDPYTSIDPKREKDACLVYKKTV